MNKLNEEFRTTELLLNLFDVFTDMPIVTAASKDTDTLSYLQKGERIINTLRAKQSRSSKDFVADSFLELLDYRKYSLLTTDYNKEEYILKQIRDRILRPAMRAYVPMKIADDGTITEENNSAFFEVLKRIPVFTASKVLKDTGAYLMASNIVPCPKRKLLSAVYQISFPESGNIPLLIPFPEECHPTPAKNLTSYHWSKRPGESYYLADFAQSFAYMYLIAQVKRLFDEEVEAISKDPERNYDDSPICVFVKSRLVELSQKHQRFGLTYVSKEAVSYPFVKKWLDDSGGQYVVVETRKMVPEGIFLLELSMCFFPWLIYGSMEDIPVRIEYVYHNNKRLAPAFSYNTESNIIKLFDLLSDEYVEEQRAHEMRARTTSEHARSFENLRGLSEAHVAKMAGSKFNDFFGYVEYDPDIVTKDGEAAFEVLDGNGNVVSTETIFSEFKAIAEIFGFTKHDDVTLRFRKLGNHHASGLWYPELRNLVVDFRTPSSFIHEYGHCLDTLARNASRADAFYQTKQLYGNLLRRATSRDKQLGERLKRGKYSLDYYLTATEVFARCFEMYCTRCCGISNVLINPSDQESFAYPKDEGLEQNIRNYFDMFLHFNSEELYNKLHPETEQEQVS